MQNSTDGFMLGIKELELYDNLIKQYINFKKQEDNYVSPEDIDELFDDESDNNNNNNNNNNNEPSYTTYYTLTNAQTTSPYLIIRQYDSNNTLINTYSITEETTINNHFNVNLKGAYNPGETPFWIYILTNGYYNGQRVVQGSYFDGTFDDVTISII